MYCEDVFDLIDRLARADRRPVRNGFLGEFQRAIGVSNVAYVAFNLPTPRADQPLLSAAHAASWRTSFAQAARVDVEPVRRAGLGGIAPVDWSVLDRDDPIVRKLLGEALDLDVSCDGVSIPLSGRKGEYALFSACLPDSASSFMRPRHELMRRLMAMSAILHGKVRDACAAESLDVALSGRELACLRLKAAGKSDDEIGLGLGVSSNAARLWLETARARLNAVTVDHAVENACRMGLIRLDAEVAPIPQSVPRVDAPRLGGRER